MRQEVTELSSEAGVTLVELMVVTLIIVILATITFFSTGRSQQGFKRQNATRELKAALERARFDSVKRRADATASPAVPLAYVTVNSNQFTLVVDENSDGDLADALDTKTHSFDSGVTVAGRSALTLPVTIYFNRRGEPSVSDVRFAVCDGSCTYDSATSSDADVLQLTATGTVNLLPGGTTAPSFNAPTVTNVNAGSLIRSETYIAPTPTP